MAAAAENKTNDKRLSWAVPHSVLRSMQVLYAGFPKFWTPTPKNKQNKHGLRPPRATVSKVQRIRRFYTNDAEKDTFINDDEKFQLI